MCGHHVGNHPINLTSGLPNGDIGNYVIQNGRSDPASFFHARKVTGFINSDTIFGQSSTG
jgi:hypothetical protein